MVVIKKVAYYAGFPAVISSAKFCNILQVGFIEQTEVKMFSRGEILLFTKKDSINRFEFVKDQKLWNTSQNIYVPIPKDWCKSYLPESRAIRIYYTPIGVFIRPYTGKEFKDYVIK